MELFIDNWRWAGVPFFIRAGKAMATSVTEIRIRFKRPPRIGFAPHLNPDADQFVIRIDPQPGAALLVQVKDPQGLTTKPVDLSLVFAEELGAAFEPYERLLHQAMLGNHALFSREDLVEETWRVVQPLIDHPPSVLAYPRGSMGPDQQDELLRGWPAWVTPWIPS
jgi:glucose-6-phosphate 1-dehydrogenase